MAEPNELCGSAAVFNFPGVPDLLAGRQISEHASEIGGVDKPLTWFRIAPRGKVLKAQP